VYFLIQGFWFSVPPSAYIIPMSTLTGDTCLLGFASNTAETFVLGDSFLVNYYAIFDDDESMLTLAPKLGASF